jgi:hypothetical protein
VPGHQLLLAGGCVWQLLVFCVALVALDVLLGLDRGLPNAYMPLCLYRRVGMLCCISRAWAAGRYGGTTASMCQYCVTQQTRAQQLTWRSVGPL